MESPIDIHLPRLGGLRGVLSNFRDLCPSLGWNLDPGLGQMATKTKESRKKRNNLGDGISTCPSKMDTTR
jgi:hypothetical protein